MKSTFTKLSYSSLELKIQIRHAFHERFKERKKFAQRKIELLWIKIAISSHRPRLWNHILTPTQKQCTSQNSLKKSSKQTLLKLCNEFDYF